MPPKRLLPPLVLPFLLIAACGADDTRRGTDDLGELSQPGEGAAKGGEAEGAEAEGAETPDPEGEASGPGGSAQGEEALNVPPHAAEGGGEGEGGGSSDEGEGEGAEGEGTDEQPPNEGGDEGASDFPPGRDPRLGQFCDGCQPRTPCDLGGACLTNTETEESFCSLRCEDALCPVGSSCQTLGGGERHCVPSSVTCVGWQDAGWPSSLGLSCTAATEADRCTDIATRCVDDIDGEDGYCTETCEPGGRCPTGYAQCDGGVCRADWEQGPEGCGRINGCSDGCDGDRVCVDELGGELDLPSLLAPFCTKVCEDAGCGDGEVCRYTDATGSRICLSPQCACLARSQGEPTLLEQAFDAAELDRCEAGFTRASRADTIPSIIDKDRYRLSWYEKVWQHSLGAVPWARRLIQTWDDAAAAATPLTNTLEAAAIKADGAIRDPRPVPGQGCDIVEALVAIWAADGKEDEADREALAEATADLPESLACKLANVIEAIAGAVALREESLAAFDDQSRRLLFDRGPGMGSTLGYPNAPPDIRQQWVRNVLAGTTLLAEPMYQAGRDLAAVVEAQDWAAEAGAVGPSLGLSTPLGYIAVRDGSDTAWTTDADRALRGRDFLLTIDLGGDDTYEIAVGANNDWDHGVSVHLDLEGDDHYGFKVDRESDDPMLVDEDDAGRYNPREGEGIGPFSLSDQARQGSGRLGVGLLWDLGGGADTYASHVLSQGYGHMGIGGLLDDGGSDSYHCERACQGGAAFGVGVLVDLGEGDDTYLSVSNTQGYGYTRGVGLLYDQGGSDDYQVAIAQPREGEGTFLFPNAQLANGGANSSMAQGTGMGRRGDSAGDFIFMSGGLGVLRDLGDGDDSYMVDVFGQATGFWFGTGVLADAGGNDSYDGKWYVQGSNAHYALAVFLEDSGDDLYNQRIDIRATAVGQGHDFSVGWLVDLEGDDVYTAPGLGMGGGNDNGIGYFIDGGGDDVYDAPDGRTFGGAGVGGDVPARHRNLCLGIFVDAAGQDDYVRFSEPEIVGEGEGEGEGEAQVPDVDRPLIGNDRTWGLAQRRPDKRRMEKGGGVDASEGILGLP